MLKFLVLLLSIFLSGCASSPEIKTIYVDKILSVNISQAYLIKDEVPKPPSMDVYNSNNYNDKEILLIDYILELYKYIKTQHNKQDAIQQQIQDFNNSIKDNK